MVEIRFARRISLKVKPDRIDEFLSRMKGEVYPELRREKGIRRVYLLRDAASTNQFVSMTLWNSKGDADAYESSGHYSANRDKVRELLEEDPAVSQLEVEYHTVGRVLRPPAAAKKARVRRAKRRRR
jgi:quinol monooxygenase YgiN